MCCFYLKINRIRQNDLFINLDKLNIRDISAFADTLGNCKFYTIRLYGYNSDFLDDQILFPDFQFRGKIENESILINTKNELTKDKKRILRLIPVEYSLEKDHLGKIT